MESARAAPPPKLPIIRSSQPQSLFKDGVFFIALDALSSADMVPSAIAEALDVEMQGLDDVLTQVKTFIGKGKFC